MKKVLFISLLLVLVSCKKNQLGGNATVKGKVVHHSKAIAGARVFIKFNAQEFPGKDTTLYDEKVLADANGNFTFFCYKGEYYLYGYGHDLAIDPPYEVVGGAPLKIRAKEEVDLQIAVTEGD